MDAEFYKMLAELDAQMILLKYQEVADEYIQSVLILNDYEMLMFKDSLSEVIEKKKQYYFTALPEVFIKYCIRQQIIHMVREGTITEAQIRSDTLMYFCHNKNECITQNYQLINILSRFNRKEFDYLIEKYLFLKDSHSIKIHFKLMRRLKIRRYFNYASDAKIILLLSKIPSVFLAQVGEKGWLVPWGTLSREEEKESYYEFRIKFGMVMLLIFICLYIGIGLFAK